MDSTRTVNSTKLRKLEEICAQSEVSSGIPFHASSFALMVCDVLLEKYLEGICQEGLGDSTHRYLEIAVETYLSTKSPFSLLASAACIKAFVSHACTRTGHPPDFEFARSSSCLERFKAIFERHACYTEEIKLHICKELKRELGSMSAMITHIGIFGPHLETFVSIINQHKSGLAVNPFKALRGYTETNTSLDKFLMCNGTGDLKSVFGNSGHFQIGAFVRKFYLPQSERSVQRAQQLVQLLRPLPGPHSRLLTQLIENKFTDSELHSCFHLQPGVTPPWQLYQVSAVLHLYCVLSEVSASCPLRLLSFDPDRAATTFVVATPSNELKSLLSAMGPHTRWKCDCGYIYMLDGCGNTNGQVSKCPTCRLTLGGNEHGRAEQGQTKIDPAPLHANTLADNDPRGFVLDESLLRDDSLHMAERGHSPASFRLLHLLSLASVMSQHLSLEGRSSTSAARIWKHIQADWTSLRTLLACGDDDLSNVVHLLISLLPTFAADWSGGLLDSREARLLWEKQFIRSCVEPHIRSIQAATQEALRKFSDSDVSSLEQNITETVIESSSDIGRFPVLMRSVVPVSINSFLARFTSDTANGDQYPLVGALVKWREKIAPLDGVAANGAESPHNLVSLLKWVTWFKGTYCHRISRKDAQEALTFKTVLQEFPEQRKNYEKFEDAWNNIRPLITQKDCMQLEMPRLSELSSVSYACVEERDSGIYIYEAIQFLTGLQNSFLDEMVLLAAQGVQAARSLQGSQGVSGVQSVAAENLEEQHIVKIPDITSLLEKWGRPKLRLGQGREHEYDFQEIENELQFDLIAGFLQDGCLLALQSLSKKVPQEQLDATAVKLIEQDEALRSHAPQVFSALEALIFWASKVGGDPEQQLQDFAEKWNSNEAKQIPFDRNSLQVLPLKHLQSAHETFEGMVSYFAIDKVDASFRKPVPTEAMDDVTRFCHLVGGFAVMENALRRFISRYLVSSEWAERAKQRICDYVEFMQWKSCQISLERVAQDFPRTLLLQHAYEAYWKIYADAEKEKKIEASQIFTASDRANADGPLMRRAARADGLGRNTKNRAKLVERG